MQLFGRLAFMSVILLAIRIAACEGCGSSGGKSDGSPPRRPALIAGYCFNNSIQFTELYYNLTVQFKGNTTATSGSGQATFSQSETKQIGHEPYACVYTNVFDLKTGPWSVTATPNGVGGPLTCPIQVPGMLVLDVS